MSNHQSPITNKKALLLILGSTGVGKTELALRVAEHLGSPVISCDSRQIFREIPIGTAAPTAEELERVQHYFIATHSVRDTYSAGQYERDAMELLEQLFQTHDTLLMTGGSMLYADAVCNGLDNLPSVPEEIRREVREKAQMVDGEGLRWLQSEVQRLDPDYWQMVDQQNPARLSHCVELCLTTGKPYSSLLTKSPISHQPSAISNHQSPITRRPFRIVKVALERPREELYARINARVHQMIANGLEQEARSVYEWREMPSLQTVGYREMFAYFEGEYDINRAIELIQQNSRHYAKRQLTWFRRDKEIHWLNANNDYETNSNIIDHLLGAHSVQEKD